MNSTDLLKALNLEAAPKETVKDHGATEVGSQKSASASVTALELDRWSLRRGKDVLQDSKRIQQLLEGDQEAEIITADFHAAAFDPDPKVVEKCVDEARHDFVKTLLETPEYHALHADTMLDPMASEIAAAAFATQYCELRKEREQNEGGGGGFPGTGTGNREIDSLRKVGKALKEAKEEVGDLRDMQAGLGMGPEGKSADPQTTASMFQRVRNSEFIRKVIEAAGRYRRFAQATQRRKVIHGHDDLVGIELDGDVGRLIASELACLNDPDLEMLAMKRIVERQAFCRQYQGVEPVAKGPVIVVVDESGSMRRRIHQAKAISLTMAWVAQHQNRWCGLIGYSGGTEGNVLALPPRRWNQEALLDWLEHFYGGGTTLDVPLKELPERYWEELGAPRGKTDVICITDGIVNVDSRMRDNFLAWKERENVKMISLVIGTEAGVMSQVSDKTYCINDLDLSEEGVQACLEI